MTLVTMLSHSQILDLAEKLTRCKQANTLAYFVSLSVAKTKKFDDIETQEERIISLKMLSQLSIDE